jgi:hypothetical protein
VTPATARATAPLPWPCIDAFATSHRFKSITIQPAGF